MIRVKACFPHVPGTGTRVQVPGTGTSMSYHAMHNSEPLAIKVGLIPHPTSPSSTLLLSYHQGTSVQSYSITVAVLRVINTPSGRRRKSMNDDCTGQALIEASKDGNLEAVRNLLKQGNVNVNFQDQRRDTALTVASSWGRLEIVCELLKHDKVDVNLCGFGFTPLIMASLTRRLEVVRELLKHKKGEC